MNNSEDPWANENSLPIREIDGKDNLPSGDVPDSGNDNVRSIVPAPRPYAYRHPLGTPEPEPHPRRRHSD